LPWAIEITSSSPESLGQLPDQGTSSPDDSNRIWGLDSAREEVENMVMVIPGHMRNGVVVLEGGSQLPEGAAVRVVYPAPTGKPKAGGGMRASFPLVRSAQPGSIDLTNDRIAEILDEEDAAPRR
jgi:hypothetical protein